jgi:hypothetical protein
MFTKKKYKLLSAEQVTAPDGSSHTLYRIQALIDIPLHEVKAGDLGGYVQNKGTLSHKGSCWVGGNAIARSYGGGHVVIDDALVTDEAFVSGRVSDSSKVSGRARTLRYVGEGANVSGNAVVNGSIYGNITVTDDVYIGNGTNMQASNNSEVSISGNVKIDAPSMKNENSVWFIEFRNDEKVRISGKIHLDEVLIRGNCVLDGEFSLKNVTFEGDTTIKGNHQIKPHVKFSGTNVLTGAVMIPPGTHVHDVVMDGGVLDYSSPALVGQQSIVGAAFVPSMPVLDPAVPRASPSIVSNEYISLISQIETEYEAYTTDIVKLIKYPAMVDTSIPEVIDFVAKLRSAKRAVIAGNEDRLKDLAESLDVAFIRAENTVRTLVTSHLDENKKKSLRNAEKMFNIACDEASPEPEKKMGFKAGMRALEGIIDVSDNAVEKMKARVGILELEA